MLPPDTNSFPDKAWSFAAAMQSTYAVQNLKPIVAFICFCIYANSITNFSSGIYWCLAEKDYSSLPLTVLLLAVSFSLASTFLWAIYKDRKNIYKWMILVSLLPLCQAMAFLAMGISVNHYGYEEFLLDFSVDEEDIPFLSRVLAFMWILLCSILPVTFYFLYKLTTFSQIPSLIEASSSPIMTDQKESLV